MQTGDVITEAQRQADRPTPPALRTALSHFHPGESVKVGWVDTAGTRHDAGVKLVQSVRPL